MTDIDPRAIAIAGGTISAGIALLLNFSVARRSNRIATASKLSELSKLLSDELVALVKMHSHLKNELKSAKDYPDQEAAKEKIKSLEGLLRINLSRQNDIDAETEYLEKAFLNLDKVDIGGVDAKISRSYRMQRIAEAKLEFASNKLKENA